jgi:glucose/arabinose dehydrogenase
LHECAGDRTVATVGFLFVGSPHLFSPFALMNAFTNFVRGVCFILGLGVGGLSALELQPGFTGEVIATELNAATAMIALDDGRIFIADQTGPIRVWQDGALLAEPALDLSARLDTYWERGLIGMALAPNFPEQPHLYILYVAKSPYTHHVVSRFRVEGNHIDPASEQVLFEGDDQATLGGRGPWAHQGGPMAFGPDGNLYIGLGEGSNSEMSQALTTLQGKILRIRPDGSIPEDNPFYETTTGKYRAIWAYGIRNPFGLTFEPETGRLWETDVGQTSFEEINLIERGGNYGWPHAEGLSDDERFVNPVHVYPPAVGRCISGGAFVPDRAPWPAAWRGQFVYADWTANWLRAMDPNDPEKQITIARGLAGAVSVQPAPDGSLLVLNRNTIWRDPKRWKADSGDLVRIRVSTAVERATQAAAPGWPPTLADTGIYRVELAKGPHAGFTEFKIAVTPWRPGTTTRNWIKLPLNGKLGMNADGEFLFPADTIMVQQHHRTSDETLWETHVFWFVGTRTARAAAYRWNDAQTDASLVSEPSYEPLPDEPSRKWLSPGPEAALDLDNAMAGFLFSINPRQLMRSGELATWHERQWCDDSVIAATDDGLAALDDEEAPIALRLRSYLDANCVVCHRPGGSAREIYDARFLAGDLLTQMIGADPKSGDLGITGAKMIVPGDPEKSILLQRLHRTDALRMPPIALSDEPAPVVSLLEAWIRSLPKEE